MAGLLVLDIERHLRGNVLGLAAGSAVAAYMSVLGSVAILGREFIELPPRLSDQTRYSR
jgi:ferredoxin-NADP reductase